MKLKRYKPTLTAGITNEFQNGWVPYMHDCDDGQWVLWEDVKKLKTENTTLKKKINMYINSMAVEPVLEVFGVACNCEAMSDIMRLRPWVSDKYWICPAHGYKRL